MYVYIEVVDYINRWTVDNKRCTHIEVYILYNDILQ